MALPWTTRGSAELVIAAPPEQLYDLVADVTTTGTRSSECHTCEWLTDGVPAGTVGARFRGRNRRGLLIRWSRVCEVVSADRPRRFAFRTVPERIDLSRRDSTTWSYDFIPDAGGTRVVHSFEITQLPLAPFKLLYGRVMPHHRDMRPSARETLELLKATVERDAAAIE
jgi:hypothetical protein